MERGKEVLRLLNDLASSPRYEKKGTLIGGESLTRVKHYIQVTGDSEYGNYLDWKRDYGHFIRVYNCIEECKPQK